MRRGVFAITISSLLLAGCASGGCPPLVKYSARQQERAAGELDAQPGSQVAQMMVDYGKLRDACRAP